MSGTLPLVSVTVADAAKVTGIGASVIWEALRVGDLVAHYPTSRPVIAIDELQAWIKSRPTESPRRRPR